MYFSTTDYFIRYSVWFLFAFGLVMFDRLSEALRNKILIIQIIVKG